MKINGTVKNVKCEKNVKYAVYICSVLSVFVFWLVILKDFF